MTDDDHLRELGIELPTRTTSTSRRPGRPPGSPACGCLRPGARVVKVFGMVNCAPGFHHTSQGSRNPGTTSRWAAGWG